MHKHRLCFIILTTFYHVCHLATGDVVKVVYISIKTTEDITTINNTLYARLTCDKINT